MPPVRFVHYALLRDGGTNWYALLVAREWVSEDAFLARLARHFRRDVRNSTSDRLVWVAPESAALPGLGFYVMRSMAGAAFLMRLLKELKPHGS